MDFGRAFNYVYEDEKWFEKVAVGALISLVPILNFALYGYMTDVIRNVAKGETRPLPTWQDLGDFFMKGLYLFVAGLVYGLVPSLILTPIIGVAIFVPMGVLPLAAGMNEDAGTALAMVSMIVFIFAIALVTLVSIAISFAAGLFSLVATIRFSVEDQTFEVLFDIKGHWEYIKTNIGQLLLAWLYVFLFSIMLMIPLWMAMLILAFIPCLGQLAAYAVGLAFGMIILLFTASIYGQLAAETGLTSPEFTE